MFYNRGNRFGILLAASAVICGAFVYFAGRTQSAARAGEVTPLQSYATARPAAGRIRYVRRGELWPLLRANLRSIGDRLERPGNERTTLTGKLSRAGEESPITLAATLEFPGRVELSFEDFENTRVVTFDGSRTRVKGGPPDPRDEDLLETLLYDTAEHFFSGRIHGMAVRFLGSHFREGRPDQTNYDGPFYDLYQTIETVRHKAQPEQRTKLYFFNCQTQLLDRVSYTIKPSLVAVEVRIGGWRSIGEQKIATQIVRMENGKVVQSLTADTVSLGPGSEQW
jgi:hypothetical protein